MKPASLKVLGFKKKSGIFDAKLVGQRYTGSYREKINLINRNIDHWPTTLPGAYPEVAKWISLKLDDNKIVSPTAFAVSSQSDLTAQFPCHICGRLGRWMADCLKNKDSKPSGEKK